MCLSHSLVLSGHSILAGTGSESNNHLGNEDEEKSKGIEDVMSHLHTLVQSEQEIYRLYWRLFSVLVPLHQDR